MDINGEGKQGANMNAHYGMLIGRGIWHENVYRDESEESTSDWFAIESRNIIMMLLMVVQRE